MKEPTSLYLVALEVLGNQEDQVIPVELQLSIQYPQCFQ